MTLVSRGLIEAGVDRTLYDGDRSSDRSAS